MGLIKDQGIDLDVPHDLKLTASSTGRAGRYRYVLSVGRVPVAETYGDRDTPLLVVLKNLLEPK